MLAAVPSISTPAVPARTLPVYIWRICSTLISLDRDPQAFNSAAALGPATSARVPGSDDRLRPFQRSRATLEPVTAVEHPRWPLHPTSPPASRNSSALGWESLIVVLPGGDGVHTASRIGRRRTASHSIVPPDHPASRRDCFRNINYRRDSCRGSSRSDIIREDTVTQRRDGQSVPIPPPYLADSQIAYPLFSYIDQAGQGVIRLLEKTRCLPLKTR